LLIVAFLLALLLACSGLEVETTAPLELVDRRRLMAARADP
jgi:hypothetical protein